MQITQLVSDDRNLITAYGEDLVAVNGVPYRHSLIVLPDALETPWSVTDVTRLQVRDLAALAEDPPEIVLLGTGTRQRFPEKSCWRQLRERFGGFEVMDTAAACRTYNLIAAEGRNVAAALIIETGRVSAGTPNADAP